MLSKDVTKNTFDSRAATEQIMVQLNVNKEQYRIGLTKIFFRSGQLAQIEELRESKVGQLLVDVQCGARAFTARNMYYKMTHQAPKIIQRNLRAFIDLKDWPWFDTFRKVKPLLNDLKDTKALLDETKATKVEADLVYLRKRLDQETDAKVKTEEAWKNLEKKVADFN